MFTASLGPTFDFTVRAGFKQQLSGKDRSEASSSFPQNSEALSGGGLGSRSWQGARTREGREVSSSVSLKEESLSQKGPLINFKH